MIPRKIEKDLKRFCNATEKSLAYYRSTSGGKDFYY